MQAGEAEARRSSILYYRVDDLERAFATLGDRGVGFVEGPHRVARMEDHDLWMAFFHDMEGNVAALMSEVPPAPPGEATTE